MDKTMKTTTFMFSMLDYKAMEEYFEKMAAQGWLLEKISAVTAKFRKTEPQNLTFTVDIFPYISIFDSPNHRNASDYRELCEQSGWHFVTSANKFQIFYAKADENPIPIQTDSVVEEKILRKSVLGTEFFLFLICLPAIMFGLGALFPFDYSRLFTNTSIVATVYYPILLIPILIYTGYYILWFSKAKRNIKRGLPLPRTSLKAARVRGLFLLCVATLLISLMLIAVIADAIGGHTFILYFLFLPITSLAIGIWYKKTVAAKVRSRGKNITIFVVAVLSIMIVFTVFMTGLVASRGRLFESITGMKNELPNGYAALELSDFGLAESPQIISFSKTSSFVVPQSYDYYEISQEGVVRTKYIRAINTNVAEYIFDGMLKREGSLIYRSVNEASADAWNVDMAYYLNNDKTMVLLLKDNIVIYLDNKLDLSQPDIVEICKDKLILE